MKPNEINKKFLEILGLEERIVTKAVIVLRPKEYPKIYIREMQENDNLENVKKFQITDIKCENDK